MENTELEELEAVTKSEGWRLFVKHVNDEWGSDGALFQGAITAAANVTDDPIATAKLRQVLVTQREIRKLMSWVGERIEYLKKTAPAVDSDAKPMSSRRGGL
jgi:hypothetical protein